MGSAAVSFHLPNKSTPQFPEHSRSMNGLELNGLSKGVVIDFGFTNGERYFTQVNDILSLFLRLNVLSACKLFCFLIIAISTMTNSDDCKFRATKTSHNVCQVEYIAFVCNKITLRKFRNITSQKLFNKKTTSTNFMNAL